MNQVAIDVRTHMHMFMAFSLLQSRRANLTPGEHSIRVCALCAWSNAGCCLTKMRHHGGLSLSLYAGDVLQIFTTHVDLRSITFA